jgi:hypothetical protein
MVVWKKLSGVVRVDGDLDAGILAYCIQCAKPEVSGTIIVGGNMHTGVGIGHPGGSGVPPTLTSLTGRIEVGGNVTAGITVLGDLGDATTERPRLQRPYPN